MENKKETFEYTYSAAQQAEIEKIKSKYISKEEDKLTRLRKLDASVTRPGTIAGIILGIVGCLVFGGGMSCCLVLGGNFLFIGILIGVVGVGLMALAYPVYNKITIAEKERVTPLILALTEELEKE